LKGLLMNEQHENTADERAELMATAQSIYEALAALPATDSRLTGAYFVVVVMDVDEGRVTVHVEDLPNLFLFGPERQDITYSSNDDLTAEARALKQDLEQVVAWCVRAAPARVRANLHTWLWLHSQHFTDFRVIPGWKPGVLVLGPPGIR
jgi:lauroyl/myristoyl acyltransferase